MEVSSNMPRETANMPRHMYFGLEKEMKFPHPEFQQFQFAVKCVKIQSPKPRPQFSMTIHDVIDFLVKKRNVSQKRTPSLYARFACCPVLSSRNTFHKKKGTRVYCWHKMPKPLVCTHRIVQWLFFTKSCAQNTYGQPSFKNLGYLSMRPNHRASEPLRWLLSSMGISRRLKQQLMTQKKATAPTKKKCINQGTRICS